MPEAAGSRRPPREASPSASGRTPVAARIRRDRKGPARETRREAVVSMRFFAERDDTDSMRPRTRPRRRAASPARLPTSRMSSSPTLLARPSRVITGLYRRGRAAPRRPPECAAAMSALGCPIDALAQHEPRTALSVRTGRLDVSRMHANSSPCRSPRHPPPRRGSSSSATMSRPGLSGEAVEDQPPAIDDESCCPKAW